jgi:WD40 repeat protein
LYIADRSGLHRWPITRDSTAQALRIGPPEKLVDRPIEKLDLSRDGQWMVFNDRVRGQVEVCSTIESGKRFVFTGLPEVDHTVISPDNRWLVTGGWPAEWRKIFDLTTQRCVREFQLAISHDSKWLLVADNEAPRLVEFGTWKPGPEIPEFRGSRRVARAVFSPDGAVLAVLRGDPVIQLLKVETLEELCTLEAPMPETCGALAFSADGSQMAVSVASRAIQRWDLRLIREGLKPMGLDWPMPDYPPVSTQRVHHVEIVNR